LDVAFSDEITQVEVIKSAMSKTENISSYFELRPIAHSHGHAARPIVPESITAAQFNVLDADFSHGGTWAGVATLVETIYFDLLKSGNTEILEAHNYELHMVLTRHRDRIPLQHGSLTDLAVGAEKTRNFPLDRAYRIAHGLIDLVIQWRMAASDATIPCLILVENFSRAQHLARRFFLDLARRASGRANLAVIVGCEGPPLKAGSPDSHLTAVPVSLPSSVATGTSTPIDRFASDEEAEQCLEILKTLDAIELNYIKVMAHYKSKGDEFRYAKAALAALHACNHLGYYYEASSFVEAVLPHFDRLVAGSEENRWNYTGNLYHSLVVQGAVKEARQIIESLAKPFLTQKALRAKMEYILGIIDLRHTTPPDLVAAEEHLTSGVDLIRASREELAPHEYVFLKVFIENGLAFLRARQGRREEAIQLCQAGFELLTRELGPEKHKLHRSVLQYNTAQVYNMMGEFDVALAHYASAIEMDPNYSEYYNEVGNIYQRQERFDQALKSYDTAIQLSAPYPEVYFNRGVCLAREEKWQMALESCDYSLELTPDQPDAHALRAEICEQLGNVDEALVSYDNAIRLSPDMVLARVNKAVLLFDKRLFASALTEMNHVIALEESEPSHYENRAAIYKEMEKWDFYQQDQKRAESFRQMAGGKQTLVQQAAG
jgi:tetratricopeptide (TPR) repeat protein